MFDELIIALVFLLILGLVWGLIKAIFKLTLKVFSCGLIVILVIALLLFFTMDVNIF